MTAIRYYKGGCLHREDGPAVIWPDGNLEWWGNGKTIRGFRPDFYVSFVETETKKKGVAYWIRDDLPHREGGPAYVRLEEEGGGMEWFIDGKLHREGGPAIIYKNGITQWWLNGEFHREDGPALIYPNGDEEWWVNGKRHREDGPAITYENGLKEWWINGKLRRDLE